MAAPLVSLGDFCEQDRTTIRAGERSDLRYIGLESIEANSGRLQEGELSKTPETPQANSFHFDRAHVLYGKLRPYLNKVLIPDFEGKCSTEIIPLRPSARLHRDYLAYFLRSPHVLSRISARTSGARMPRADMAFVLSLRIRLPSIPEQLRIIDVISRAEGILRMRREARTIAAELVPAIFHNMFGDPTANLKRWPVLPLCDVAKVISGAAKGREISPEEAVELPYLRVANVKDGHLDLTEVKTLRIKRGEVARLRLEIGDLLMTEGGDADKLGRAALWQGEIALCVHQNHVFKVRSDRSLVAPEYLRALAGSAFGKGYFLQVAKRTTGIASINKTQLSAFPIVLPPLNRQQEFAARCRELNDLDSQMEIAFAKARDTFASLLGQTFA